MSSAGNSKAYISIPFGKGHANGNDFIFLYSHHLPQGHKIDRLVKKLCSRHTGIGADGLFVISSSKKYDFILDYYNADGSWETLCGNGSRCAIKFMDQEGYIEGQAKFKTGDGTHFAKILSNGNVSMQMNPPKYESKLISIGECKGYFINSGARHFVCESNNLDDDYIYEQGKKIRYSDCFAPRGLNVNFFKLLENNVVKICTYEKGVEQVVRSCASGATAVVFHLHQKGKISSSIITRSAGGKLVFHFDKQWIDAWVEGPACILFTGAFMLQSDD